jgi:hypothetical protein
MSAQQTIAHKTPLPRTIVLSMSAAIFACYRRLSLLESISASDTRQSTDRTRAYVPQRLIRVDTSAGST